VSCLLLGLLVAALAVLALRPRDDFTPVRYLQRLGPVSGLPTLPVREAREALSPGELVLGVTAGGESRAYPINLLNDTPGHKILNDVLGGTPVAASWCDACQNAIVYDRRLDGRTLTLAPEGELWKESMVFYDQETGSLWSHLLGLAKRGPLRGKRLSRLPAVVTDWETWSAHNPDGSVVLIPYGSTEYSREVYANPERFVLGIEDGARAKAWGLDRLARDAALNDDWAGRPVVGVLDRAGVTARLYERTLGGRVLTFRAAEGRLTDDETGGTWDPVTGKALTGPLAGQFLAPLPALVSLRDAWLRFHPDSE
jgi:hypothetical protein